MRIPASCNHARAPGGGLDSPATVRLEHEPLDEDDVYTAATNRPPCSQMTAMPR
jgi:hypothetical protein